MRAARYEEALKLALERIRLRDRFSLEVRQYLDSRGFDPETNQSVVSFLEDRKILNDKRTTLSLIERRSGKRSVGKEKLRSELIAKGAPEELVDECLAGLPEEDEPARMAEALSARFKRTDDRAKAARFLLSRGFTEDGLESVLDRFFASD